MALKKCPECGNDVSSSAKSCPRCGYARTKGHGCLYAIGVVVLVLIGLGAIGSQIDPNKNKSSNLVESKAVVEKVKETTVEVGNVKSEQYRQGQTINVGYTSYLVTKSWWSDKLSENEFLNQKPDAQYLFVELVVRNDDKKARVVPPFNLVDENGAEYEASSKSWAVEGSLGIIESLNPSVSKQGFVVFDVPRSRSYRLKLSGGFWSGEHVFVKITPEK